MKSTIEHFQKLLLCKDFIVTGSYALRELGLTGSVKDLDIILVAPDESSIESLKRLAEPHDPLSGYPPREDHYRVIFNGLKVDFFIRKEPCLYIALGSGLKIAYPKSIVQAKKKYGSIKHVLQLKAISEIFYTPNDLKVVLDAMQQKVTSQDSTKVNDDFDMDDFLSQVKKK